MRRWKRQAAASTPATAPVSSIAGISANAATGHGGSGLEGLEGAVLALPAPGPPPFRGLPRHADASARRAAALSRFWLSSTSGDSGIFLVSVATVLFLLLAHLIFHHRTDEDGVYGLQREGGCDIGQERCGYRSFAAGEWRKAAEPGYETDCE